MLYGVVVGDIDSFIYNGQIWRGMCRTEFLIDLDSLEQVFLATSILLVRAIPKIEVLRQQ